MKIFFQYVRQIIYIFLYKFFCIFTKLDKDKVLFLSLSRNSLTGNFKFVYDEIKKRKKYKINILLKSSLKNKYNLIEKFKLVYNIATSKYIFLDDFYPIIYALKLRKGTELIQLWHAIGAFKKVGYSRNNTKNSLTHKNYTGTIVSSEFIKSNYAEAFGISIDKVHSLGIPRTDVFFDKKYSKNIKEKLYKKYPELVGKKVILFAPTFRGKGQNSAYYNFDWFDFDKFSKELNDEYICIVKMHPFIKNHPNFNMKEDPFYINLTLEREINDLLFITDVLITDYSSVIFEYSFFEKQIIFYVPDFDEYKHSRDFYYDFDKYTYGPVTQDFEELIKLVKNSKIDSQKLKGFKSFFCSSCDGKSTKRVVDYFLGKKD
ncbi:MAG: CDP-glycerol glycerophosphotransferase family protein [bacterium]|nr:CDP-glycerol glycerophosphotransferase family protein [bacterium]